MAWILCLQFNTSTYTILHCRATNIVNFSYYCYPATNIVNFITQGSSICTVETTLFIRHARFAPCVNSCKTPTAIVFNISSRHLSVKQYLVPNYALLHV